MLTDLLAWAGLIAVLLISLHWALQVAGRRLPLPAPLRRLSGLLDRLVHPFDPDHRAERRRQQRIDRARMQREAIARASAPVPLDEPVSWEGNVARPQFGAKRPRQPLH
ncbi:hypothetical protein [Inhella sp.]|uniref:hypothetical protein n=1 Tax=Inhella sp. TaxID=1921806 RepID=UPI0035B1A6A3